MSSLIALALLWVLSPFALIPMVIIFYDKNTKLRRRIKELEDWRGGSQPVQQPQSQRTMVSQPQSLQSPQTIQPQVAPQKVQPQVAPQKVQPQVAPQPVYSARSQYINAPSAPKPRKKVNTMNIVFVIGVIFIVIAGLIFATTTWNILPDFMKAAVIALLIVLFFGASVLARNKLMLKQTGLTFYSLGSLFIPLAFLGIGYFELLGNYLSVQGEGKYILSLIASVCLTVACVFGVKIYQSKLYIWFTYIAGTAGIVSLIWQFAGDLDVRILILSIYCAGIVILAKQFVKQETGVLSQLGRYSYISFYIVSIALLISFFMEGAVSGRYYWIIGLICIMITMSYMMIKMEQRWMQWIHPLISVIIIMGLTKTLPVTERTSEITGEVFIFLAFLAYRFLRYHGISLFRNKLSDILPICICLYMGYGLEDSWIIMNSAVFSMIMIASLAFEKKQDWLSVTARFIFPWSIFYLYICSVIAFHPQSEESVFMVFYLFTMLFTILLILLSEKDGRLSKLKLPFSIMVWISGAVMIVGDFATDQADFVPAYLWLLTLYSITMLYESISSQKRDTLVAEDQTPKHSSTYMLSVLWLYIVGFMVSFSISITVGRVFQTWPTVKRLCVPMLFVAVALIIYLIPAVYNRMNLLRRETGIMLNVLVHGFVILMTCGWCSDFAPELWIGLLTLFVILLCQYALYQQGNMLAGLISMILFFVLSFHIVDETGFTYDICQLILLGEFLCVSLIGRWIYPKLLESRREEKGFIMRFDWLSVGAVCIPIGLFFGDEVWCFVSSFLFILYLFNYLRRIDARFNRPIISAAAFFLCVAWWVQPFITLPEAYTTEINMIVFLLVVLGLYKLVWKGCERIMYWVMYAAIAICLFLQFTDCFYLYDMSLPLSRMIEYMILLCGIMAVAVWAFCKKSLSYSILTQVMLMLGLWCSSSSVVSTDWTVNLMIHIGFLVLVIETILCMWTLYRLRMMWSGIVPAGVLLVIFNMRLDFVKIHLGFNNHMIMIAWTLLFLTILLLSYLLHHNMNIVKRVEAKGVLIDWYAIINIVPTLVLLGQSGDSPWHFVGLFMLVVYLLGYYRRIHPSFDRPILSFICFIGCIMWWTQPFFLVPLIMRSEWKMIPFILLSLCLYKWIWRGYEKVFSWIFYAMIDVCMVWQGIDAIRGKVLSDVLILGVAALIILLVSFWSKSKRWFLLASITLITLILYSSRDFWKSIAWWIYLLAAGVILITLASVNEYYKKKGEQRESRIKRLMQDWEW